MVKELRKIILDNEEFVAALESYKRTNFEFLPAGKVIQCTLKANEPVVVGLETSSFNKIKTTDFTFSPPELMEPLIRFCIENNVMLPRNSRKSVLIGDNQAVLFLQISALDAMDMAPVPASRQRTG